VWRVRVRDQGFFTFPSWPFPCVSILWDQIIGMEMAMKEKESSLGVGFEAN
jgi:hypothetical protein